MFSTSFKIVIGYILLVGLLIGAFTYTMQQMNLLTTPTSLRDQLDHRRHITHRIISQLYDLLKSQLRILHAGISLGELKGKDWQPSHALAMSTVFERDSFPMAELTYSQAIAYLRKEAVVLSPEVPKV